MKLFIPCMLVIICLCACSNDKNKTPIKSRIKGVIATQNVSKTGSDTLTIPEDTIAKITIPIGTIQVGLAETDSTGRVLDFPIGAGYNDDNIDSTNVNYDWRGIFLCKNKYYIKPTKVSYTRAISEFDDPDSGKITGWAVHSSVKDSCTALIGNPKGKNYLSNGPLKPLFSKEIRMYYAGQKITFNCEGVVYTLYTTGRKEEGVIKNCKLYLLARVKGHYINQLLKSIGNDTILNGGGDSASSIELQFVADLDGDKVPDFMISGSGFPFGETELFLSKPAGRNAILKSVAYFYQSD